MPCTLSAAEFVVEVHPERGGSIARFECAGLPVFRAGAGPDPRDMACFPLVPFSNRVRDGLVPAPGRPLAIAPLPGFGPHPIHGLGWRSAWTIDAGATDRIAMTHAHKNDAHWPFDYRARQVLRLDESGLAVTLSLANESGDPMPAGIGLHPYFHATPLASLATDVADFWAADAEVLPTHREPVPAELPFARGCTLAGTALDNCFGGWSGRATLRWPERGLALDIEAEAPLRTLVIYTPPGRDFFCVEPASHLNNGFQLAAAGVRDSGVRLLAPGEALVATVRFAPRRT